MPAEGVSTIQEGRVDVVLVMLGWCDTGKKNNTYI
jgi:hypothetical protein